MNEPRLLRTCIYLTVFLLLAILASASAGKMGTSTSPTNLPNAISDWSTGSGGPVLDWDNVEGVVRLFIDAKLTAARKASHIVVFYAQPVEGMPQMSRTAAMGIYAWDEKTSRYNLIQEFYGLTEVRNNVVVQQSEDAPVRITFTWVGGDHIERDIYEWRGRKFEMVFGCLSEQCSFIRVNDIDAVVDYGGTAGSGFSCTLSVYKDGHYRKVSSHFLGSDFEGGHICIRDLSSYARSGGVIRNESAR